MKFGIMSMQLEALVPSGKPVEQILTDLAGFSLAGLAQKLFSAGYNPIELGGDLSLFLPQTFNQESIQALVKAREEGILFTVHLPLWSVEPSTPLSPVRQGAVKALVEIISACMALEPEVFVLHATGATAAEFSNMKISEMARGLILSQFKNAAKLSIQSILEQTGLPSRRLAIETIEFPLDLTLDLAEELDLSICLDTGHVLAGFPGWYDLFEVLERVLPRLAEVHLHDSRRMPQGSRGYGEDHKPLGQGDLDLGRFLDRLDQVGYQGPLVFELTLDEAARSIEHIRNLRPQYLK